MVNLKAEQTGTFGVWRYFLAMGCVAVSHLYTGMVNGPAAYAVWGFYTLSGFLMTLILLTKYDKPGGKLEFFRARFLKIYPGYWFAAAFFTLIIFFWPALMSHFDPGMSLPKDAGQSFYHLSLCSLWSASPVVPGMSTLRTEVFFYIFIALAPKTLRFALFWLAASILFECFTWQNDFGWRYAGSLCSMSLPFALGAVVCHLRHVRIGTPAIAITLWILYAGLIHLWADPLVLFLYLSPFVSGWVVLTLSQVKPSAKWLKIDTYLGNLSYPVYICHYVGAMLVYVLFGFEKSNPLLIILSVPTIHACAHTLHYCYQVPVERFGKSLRLVVNNARRGNAVDGLAEVRSVA